MIVDSALYRGGRREPAAGRTHDLEALRAAAQAGDFVWVGLHEPSPEELGHVAVLFDLHPLAVEDAVHPVQRPKLEHYGDMVFLVLKTLWYVDAADAVETGQVSMFMGPGYVVTVRSGQGVELASVRQDLEQNEGALGHGPAAVIHAVCDRVVDGYQDVMTELEIDVDEVEATVFSDERAHSSKRIYVLKRELAEVRRAVHPLRAPMERFALGVGPDVNAQTAPFFRDVADHVIRVGETVDSLDQLLTSAFEAHMARISVQQNEDMRRISAWVAIAAVATMVAGIYGMNFDHMPELHWRYGYAMALMLMVVPGVVLYRLFKRSGWL